MHRIEDYTEKTELHKGRHSVVWSAKDCDGEIVVIKAYKKAMMRLRHARHVVRETRLLQVFRDHKCAACAGVVRLQHAFEDDACVYLILEPCMRGDLYQLMTKHNGKLDESFVACQIIAPLLSTLTLLHALNIVHRDIKTENVFLAGDGEVQLGDFGLVAHKLHDPLTDRVGTLDYMAPEVLVGAPSAEDSERDVQPGSFQQTYDEKVDIWAVGILLYELLVGRPPFEVEDPKETARLILAAQVELYPDHLPPDCIEFMAAALEKDPADRPSAEQLQHHRWLQRHLQSSHNCRPPANMHHPSDIQTLRQQIYDAWVTDKLEQSAQDPNCNIRSAGHGSSGASTPYSTSGSPGMFGNPAMAMSPTRRPKLSPDCIEEEGAAAGVKSQAESPRGGGPGSGGVPMHLLNTPEKSWAPGRIPSGGNTIGPTSSGSMHMEGLSEGEFSVGQEEGCRTPDEDPSRELSFQVLGKDLSSSVARLPSPRRASSSERNLGGTGRIPRVGSGLRDPTRSHSGEPTANDNSNANEWKSTVQSSSQSFTSGMRPTMPPPDAPQAWQRTPPPSKSAGRSRFAA